ncbi:GNAT family N-acetyltransferase [Nocardioides aquiterrae]|uniref:N-acetyltransferase domain-containing protein n=1 Tax=Nocardioides aquiterrae TaxID=203799 RepID=A0ABN1U6G4_9ACTN
MTLLLRPAGPADVAHVDALLRGLSADSAYLRFQTGIGTPSPKLVRALLPEQGALLGFVDGEVAAHGLWVRSGRAAEIALVVADAHQRRGIGTAVAEALIADAAAHGIARIEAFSGAGNGAVARMVGRQAPHALRVLDGSSVTYTFSTLVSGGGSVGGEHGEVALRELPVQPLLVQDRAERAPDRVAL